MISPGERISIFLRPGLQESDAVQVVGWGGVFVASDAAAIRFTPTVEHLDNGAFEPVMTGEDDHVVPWDRIVLMTVNRPEAA